MIGIVDYGCGNLFSLKSSFARLGAATVVSGDARELGKCDRIVLPGVGAFADAAQKLTACGLDKAVVRMSKHIPLLGICLGMQLLFEKSFEYGEHAGLGLLEGSVVTLKDRVDKGYKIPQMGWNALAIVRKNRLLARVKDGDHMYFVHSYHAVDCRDSVTAVVDYGGDVTAAVERGNVFGTQFHPEKSGDAGLAVLKAFTEL